MEIERVVIERQEGGTYCGVLTYAHNFQQRLLTWSFAPDLDQKIVLLLYPSSSSHAYPEVQTHYRLLADAILAEILQAKNLA